MPEENTVLTSPFTKHCRLSDSSQTLEDTEGPLLTKSLPQACAKACESPKTPSKASDASEWSATMACVGGTASAARLKRPKSSAQRFSASRSLRSTPWQVVVEFVAETNFPDAEGRMLVARPDFGRCPQHWRPPGPCYRRAQQRWRPALAGSGCVTYVRTR